MVATMNEKIHNDSGNFSQARRPILTIVGSYNVDLVMKSKRLPQVGETITGGFFLDGVRR